MIFYEYGYIVSAKNEKRRVVLGTVNETEYEAKKKEICSAIHISNTQGDENTVWLIEERPTAAPQEE